MCWSWMLEGAGLDLGTGDLQLLPCLREEMQKPLPEGTIAARWPQCQRVPRLLAQQRELELQPVHVLAR